MSQCLNYRILAKSLKELQLKVSIDISSVNRWNQWELGMGVEWHFDSHNV